MPLDTTEEVRYFNLEKKLAADRLLAEGVEELVRLMLRRAFGEGYRAKERYDELLKEEK